MLRAHPGSVTSEFSVQIPAWIQGKLTALINAPGFPFEQVLPGWLCGSIPGALIQTPY